MCLAVPYQVVEIIDEENCLVKVGSGSQKCFAGLVENIKLNDWLVVHAGVAIEKIDKEDAEENLKVIAEWTATLDE